MLATESLDTTKISNDQPPASAPPLDRGQTRKQATAGGQQANATTISSGRGPPATQRSLPGRCNPRSAWAGTMDTMDTSLSRDLGPASRSRPFSARKTADLPCEQVFFYLLVPSSTTVLLLRASLIILAALCARRATYSSQEDHAGWCGLCFSFAFLRGLVPHPIGGLLSSIPPLIISPSHPPIRVAFTFASPLTLTRLTGLISPPATLDRFSGEHSLINQRIEPSRSSHHHPSPLPHSRPRLPSRIPIISARGTGTALPGVRLPANQLTLLKLVVILELHLAYRA